MNWPRWSPPAGPLGGTDSIAYCGDDATTIRQRMENVRGLLFFAIRIHRKRSGEAELVYTEGSSYYSSTAWL